jgi:hypothetical protein
MIAKFIFQEGTIFIRNIDSVPRKGENIWLEDDFIAHKVLSVGYRIVKNKRNEIIIRLD